MGCSGSSNGGPDRRVRTHTNSDGLHRHSSAVQVPTSPPACFELITQGARQISGTSMMMPVVCLSRESFPIITYAQTQDDFLLNEGSPPLPIIAGSIVGNGRVLCFSQIELLLVRHFVEEGNKKIISNSFRWLSACVTSMVQILAIDFEKSIQQSIRSSLQEMSYDAEFVKSKIFTGSLKNFKVLLLPSDLDVSNDTFLNSILEFVQEGGGIAVFFTSNSQNENLPQVPINRLLLKFNLAFTLFVLDDGGEPTGPIPVPENYAKVRDVNLVPLVARFKATVKQSSVDDQALDDVVTALRFYVAVCDDSHTEELEQVKLFLGLPEKNCL
jgi:hypothetical protein